MANALAYCNMATITTEKSFIVHALKVVAQWYIYDKALKVFFLVTKRFFDKNENPHIISPLKNTILKLKAKIKQLFGYPAANAVHPDVIYQDS